APPTPERPSFEVASVKPNKTGDGRVMIANQPGGGLVVTNMPLRLLLTFAFQLQDFQLVGVPDWAANERFDIVAKATSERPENPAASAPGNAPRLMLQSLLAERFKLATHPETRPLQI